MKEGDFPSPFRFASSFDNANIVKKSDIQIFIGKILTHGAPLRDELTIGTGEHECYTPEYRALTCDFSLKC